MLTYEIEFEDLSGPGTAAHLHGPATPGVGDPAVIPIAGAPGPPPPGHSPLGIPYVGTVGPLTLGQEADLLAGLVYVRIHTGFCPPGELRGQLMPD